jgi:hypothetical protein
MNLPQRKFGFLVTVLGFSIGAAGQSTAHAPDGGVRQTLISISIPTLTNAPFSATVETEWTKVLPDGSTATTMNHRTVARDSSGRVFEERRYLLPNGDKMLTPLASLEMRDPGRHEFYECIPQEKTCYVSKYAGAALTSTPVAAGSTASNVEQQALGQKQIEGLDAVGSREITTIPQGAVGNQKPEPIVKEFWYSPHLGVNLVVKRFDPRNGVQNFAVDHISLDEPDPRIFALPEGYRVVQAEERGPAR